MEEKRIRTRAQIEHSNRIKQLKQDAQQAINTIMFNIGEFIEKKREEKNMSIRELSHLSNVSNAVISDIENGKSMPRVELLVRLALTMEISLSELFANFVSQSYTVKPVKEQEQTLSSMLQMTGLTKIEVKEVLEFIEFKKSRQKK